MERLRNTLELAKVSWRVLMKDRELLWLPVMSMVASLILLAVLAIPSFAMLDSGTVDPVTGEQAFNPAIAVLGIIGLMGLSIIAVFFNGALVAGAYERMSGGDPTVSSSVSKASRHIGGLVPWAIATATVGLILQAIRERAGFLGNIVTSIAGAAWELVTFLVVPAIIIDDLGAVDGVKRSGSLLKQTWGENIAARVGFGLLGFAAALPLIVVVGLFVASGVTVMIVLGVIIAVVGIVLLSAVLTSLNAIFQTALYLYATTGQVPSDFAGTNLSNTFTQK